MDEKTLPRILIVDDTPTNLEVLVDALQHEGFELVVATDGERAIERAVLTSPDLVLLDVMMPGIDGFETCRRLRSIESTQGIPVIFMTARSETEDKVRGFQVGGVDYVTKPIQHAEVTARIRTHLLLHSLQKKLKAANISLEQRVVERTRELEIALAEVAALKEKVDAENIYLRSELEYQRPSIIGSSGQLSHVFRQIEQVAHTKATVLILGETGTGKELVANEVHVRSQRVGSLVRVNCAALPESLMESELFGHEKGAFTGAHARKIGRFELADQGTILLDEIGDLPIALQAKLLRVLQEGEIERIGGTRSVSIDVRVIAATNVDLQKAIEDGRFREDLYYRLHVFPIELPPLRSRRDDISILVDYFVQKHSQSLGKHINGIASGVIDALRAYDWPGNVRELENVIERGIIMQSGNHLELGPWLPLYMKRETQYHSVTESQVAREDFLACEARNIDDEWQTLDQVQRLHIERTLQKSDWVVSGKRGAARLLGMRPTTLEARMKKLGVVRPKPAPVEHEKS
ncbi:MAG: sigma-54 dependent transcriptional regulator [Myxococcota bacterium]